MQGMATTAYTQVLLGAMTTQMTHYTRSPFLLSSCLRRLNINLIPLDKVLVHLGGSLANCLLKGSPWGDLAPVRATERGLHSRYLYPSPSSLRDATSPLGEAFLALPAIHLVSHRRGSVALVIIFLPSPAQY